MAIHIISTVVVIVFISKVTILMNMILTVGVQSSMDLKKTIVKNSNLNKW